MYVQKQCSVFNNTVLNTNLRDEAMKGEVRVPKSDIRPQPLTLMHFNLDSW